MTVSEIAIPHPREVDNPLRVIRSACVRALRIITLTPFFAADDKIDRQIVSFGKL